MRLVTFCQDYSGYAKGASQYFEEVLADQLIEAGVVRDAYMEPIEEELEDKALDKPVKDKMVKAPRKKK